MKIKKGTHKPFRLPELVLKNTIKGFVLFNGDFSYKIDKQEDTNKLFGFSDGWHHHQDSIRLGWRYYNDELEIMTITYSNGKRNIKHLTYIESNTTYSFSIQIKGNEYIVNFGSSETIINRTSKWVFLRYVLKPYFGGSTKAPKDFKFNYDYYYE